jgi:transcriptional regulator with XRE-family HTH domain
MEDLHTGKTIKKIRTQKKYSVRKVAGMAGITPSMLSQIENEQTNPSLNTLRSIAQALDEPLYRFFKENETESYTVIHPSTRKTLGLKSTPDVRYELLTPDTNGDIEFIMMIIPAGLSSYHEEKSHVGEEVAYMYDGGVVTLEMEDKNYELQPGDSFRIPPNTGHVWHNRSDKEVRVIFAVTPPSF